MDKIVYAVLFTLLLASSHAQETDIPVKGYELLWADEFNGAILDMKKWDYRGLGPRRDAVNVKDTVTLDRKGHLVLATKKQGDSYHTAMIGTQGKFETTFGYFECRVQLQKQVGHWSAFWLQSPTIGKKIGVTGESGTEIDIFEYLKREGDTVHHTLHWDGYQKDHKTAKKTPRIPGLSKGWHRCGLRRSTYSTWMERKPGGPIRRSPNGVNT